MPMTREQALEMARRFDMRLGERRSRLADLILSIDAKARAEERARVVKLCEPIHEALNALAGCMPNKVYIYGAYGELWSDYLPDDVDEFEEVEFSKLAEFPEVTK